MTTILYEQRIKSTRMTSARSRRTRSDCSTIYKRFDIHDIYDTKFQAMDNSIISEEKENKCQEEKQVCHNERGMLLSENRLNKQDGKRLHDSMRMV